MPIRFSSAARVAFQQPAGAAGRSEGSDGNRRAFWRASADGFLSRVNRGFGRMTTTRRDHMLEKIEAGRITESGKEVASS
jgi:hypothetical protein